jgi:hypothetical protein
MAGADGTHGSSEKVKKPKEKSERRWKMSGEKVFTLGCDGEEEASVLINPQKGTELVLPGTASGEIHSGKEYEDEYEE